MFHHKQKVQCNVIPFLVFVFLIIPMVEAQWSL